MTRKVAFLLATTLAVLFPGSASAVAQEQGGPEEKAKQLEELLVHAQKICPVSGKDLESMGGPIKATAGEQTIFLCCKGCVGKKLNKEHWAEANANLKSAQKRCPVRNVVLEKEAVPVVVQKRTVFVCCDSGYCIRQVKAKPDKYIAAVNKLLEKNLNAEEDKQR